VPINLAMSLVLIWFEGVREAAFAISTTTTSALSVLVGLVLLQRKTQTRLADRAALWAAAQMLGATAVSALVVHELRHLWTPGLCQAVDATVLRRAVDTLGALMLGCGLFLGLGALLKLPETRLVLHYRRSP
jgi:peptidoglycan biosynthesis protein MviN/MurJ (putative lipid II flippase)